jgi:DNA (cytosine-5)-methyltransferase 1
VVKVVDKKFNIVSLFSGCGGLDLGFKMTEKFNVIWANDKFHPACETFANNFDLRLYTNPKEKITEPSIFAGEIEEINNFSKILGSKDIDVITGGPPCQDFSIVRGSGKRKGIKVKRGKLYTHFVRALISLQPKTFVFENVKGLMSANKELAYKAIMDDFKSLDIKSQEMKKEFSEFSESFKEKNGVKKYEIIFSGIVDFSKLGVPQKRERLVIIGIRKDIADFLSIMGRPIESIEEEIERTLKGNGSVISRFPLTPLEVFHGNSLGRLADEYRNVMHEYQEAVGNIGSRRSEEFIRNVWPNYTFEIWRDYIYLNKLDDDNIDRNEIEAEHIRLLQELGFYHNPLNERIFGDNSNEILKENESVISRMSFIPPAENHKFVEGTEHNVVGLMSNIYRRIHPIQPSPTIIAMGGGGTWGYHYARHRQKLTNRERARLQTFPDDFLFSGKPDEVRRQIGEAVPPLATKRISEIILRCLEVSPHS